MKCGQRIKDPEFLRDHKGDTHIICPPPKRTNEQIADDAAQAYEDATENPSPRCVW